jgi:DNA repair ATPase RecN
VETYRLMKLQADLRRADEVIRERVARRNLLEDQLADFDLVQILLTETSDYARRQAKERMEQIVTQALSVVFSKDYSFEIKLDVKANQPVALYYLHSEGVTTQLKPPDYDRGGGIADIVSLALRLAVGELSNIKGPLFLDEIGKHVSQEYSQNVAYFLKQYSEKFDRQIVLITHNTELAQIGDQSLGVRIKKGVSEVTPI